MFAILCCAAIIPLVVGVVAFLGRSNKDKKLTNHEAAITQEERNQ